MTDKQDVIVIKRDPHGNETWRYTGQILEQGQDFIRLEAWFNRPDTPFHGIILGHGDHFIETYFSNRWYNIMEMHDRSSGELKGWYCNVTYPAAIEPGIVSYRDLALDLLVYPDGRQLVLDEEEFSALDLSADESASARRALLELQERFQRLFLERKSIPGAGQ